jgi:hypothetical protein
MSAGDAGRPEPGRVVHDARPLVEALERLHASGEGVLFRNADDTLWLLLRAVSDDPAAFACELAIQFDEDLHDRLLETTCGGTREPGGVYVFKTWEAAGVTEDLASDVMDAVNRAHLYRACGCGGYLIRDGGPVCVFCQMTSIPGEPTEQCPVCHEEGPARHLARQPCCGGRVHAACMAAWRATGDGRCVLCRRPG